MAQYCYPGSPGTTAQPAIPPTPGQLTIAYNAGWNAGGRSVDSVIGDGGYSFRVNTSAVGVIVGLNDADEGYGYHEMEHALYFTHGAVQAYAGGVFAASLGYYTHTDVFSILRVGSEVRYLKNGLLLRTVPSTLGGSFFLDASMYLAGDSVYDAVLADPDLYLAAGTNNVSLPSTATGYGGYTSIGYGAALPATTEAYTLNGHGWGLGISLPSVAQGFSGSYAQGWAASLPAYAIGSDLLQGGIVTALPSTTEAYAGAYAISINSAAPSTALGTGGFIQPSWAVSLNVSVQSVSIGRGLTGEIGGQTSALSSRSWGRGSNFPTGEGSSASLPSTTYGAQYTVVSYLIADLPGGYEVVSNVTARDRQGVDQTLPAIQVTGYSGAHLVASLPKVSLHATGTVDSVGRVTASLPHLQIWSTGIAGGASAAMLTLFGEYSTAAYTGAQVWLQTDGRYGVSSAGKTGGIAAAQLTHSTGYAVTSRVTAEAYARADMLLPALTTAPSGQAWLVGPALSAYAVAGEVVEVTYEAYAINLSTGAVTHYTNYPFDNILRFGNEFYGVAATGLYYIGGATDLGAEITCQLRTFPTDFKGKNLKRVAYSYLTGRADQGVVVGVTPDEGLTHNYESSFGEDTQLRNHRSTLGKGLRGVYYDFSISNVGGGQLEVDELSIQVVETQRAV